MSPSATTIRPRVPVPVSVTPAGSVKSSTTSTASFGASSVNAVPTRGTVAPVPATVSAPVSVSKA